MIVTWSNSFSARKHTSDHPDRPVLLLPPSRSSRSTKGRLQAGRIVSQRAWSILLVPFIDRMVRVDLRVVTLEFPSRKCHERQRSDQGNGS